MLDVTDIEIVESPAAADNHKRPVECSGCIVRWLVVVFTKGGERWERGLLHSVEESLWREIGRQAHTHTQTYRETDTERERELRGRES